MCMDHSVCTIRRTLGLVSYFTQYDGADVHDLDTNHARAFPGRCIQTTWQVAPLYYTRYGVLILCVNAVMLLNPDEVWREAFCL